MRKLPLRRSCATTYHNRISPVPLSGRQPSNRRTLPGGRHSTFSRFTVSVALVNLRHPAFLGRGAGGLAGSFEFAVELTPLYLRSFSFFNLVPNWYVSICKHVAKHDVSRTVICWRRCHPADVSPETMSLALLVSTISGEGEKLYMAVPLA